MEKNLKKLLATSLTLTTFLTVPAVDSNNSVQASETSATASTVANSAETVNELNQLKENFKQYLVGNQTLNSNPLLAGKINSVHNTANTKLGDFIPREEREQSLFKGTILGEDPKNLSNSYLYLYQYGASCQDL